MFISLISLSLVFRSAVCSFNFLACIFTIRLVDFSSLFWMLSAFNAFMNNSTLSSYFLTFAESWSSWSGIDESFGALVFSCGKISKCETMNFENCYIAHYKIWNSTTHTYTKRLLWDLCSIIKKHVHCSLVKSCSAILITVLTFKCDKHSIFCIGLFHRRSWL